MHPSCRCPTAAPLALALVTPAPVVHTRRPLEDAYSLAEVRGGPTSRRPPNNYETNDVYLRRQLQIAPHLDVDLWALPDCPPHLRPDHTLEVLAKLAIHGIHGRAVQNGRYFRGCTYMEVCDEIARRFPYFNSSSAGAWRNSVRSVLTKKRVFDHDEDEKPGGWWLDFSHGEGDKLPRKRGSGSSSSDFE
ncbi:hypothetical protein GGG16DRAFT_98949 [Schizophyllum commune]